MFRERLTFQGPDQHIGKPTLLKPYCFSLFSTRTTKQLNYHFHISLCIEISIDLLLLSLSNLQCFTSNWTNNNLSMTINQVSIHLLDLMLTITEARDEYSRFTQELQSQLTYCTNQQTIAANKHARFLTSIFNKCFQYFLLPSSAVKLSGIHHPPFLLSLTAPPAFSSNIRWAI